MSVCEHIISGDGVISFLCFFLSMSLYGHTQRFSWLVVTASPTASVKEALEQQQNSDFAKTKAFEIEKPVLSRITLRGPAHQLAV